MTRGIATGGNGSSLSGLVTSDRSSRVSVRIAVGIIARVQTVASLLAQRHFAQSLLVMCDLTIKPLPVSAGVASTFQGSDDIRVR